MGARKQRVDGGRHGRDIVAGVGVSSSYDGRMGTILLFLLLAAPDVDVDALVEEYFEAGAARRRAIREELEPVDRLEREDVAQWRERLLELAAKTAPRLRRRGTNYFYDEDKKRGKYIVQGGRGRGGLLIGLHGGGEGAGDAGSAAGTFGRIASKFRCVGIFPEVLEKTERGWTTSGTEEFVVELVDAAKRTWPRIPHDRIYVVGHSMGGYGAWTIGARHADLFAGLGAYAGAPTPITVDGGPYSEVIAIAPGVLPNLRNVALHVYQSLDDKQVPPEPNVFANKELQDWKKRYGGFNYKYLEVDGRGHGAPPGGHVEGVKWLYRFERNPRPKKILWQPVLSWKRMFYWLYWTRPEPEVVVDVRIVEPNAIAIDLGGASRDGFKLLLDDDLVDLSKEVVVRVAGGEEIFRAKVPYTLSTMLLTAGERYDRRCVFPARIDLGE